MFAFSVLKSLPQIISGIQPTLNQLERFWENQPSDLAMTALISLTMKVASARLALDCRIKTVVGEAPTCRKFVIEELTTGADAILLAQSLVSLGVFLRLRLERGRL